MTENKKQHWETIYKTKQPYEVSWTQTVPQTSLALIMELNLPLNAKIIDVGGGDSLLVDNLLALGYTDVTVLDISEIALERAKERLGKLAEKVQWIATDVINFEPKIPYDIWHDRAVFHFSTDETEIGKYIDTIQKGLSHTGMLIIGTFSEEGPAKCSGIEIKQYSEQTLTKRLQQYFRKVKCIYVDHITPFKTVQNFIFCSFKIAA